MPSLKYIYSYLPIKLSGAFLPATLRGLTQRMPLSQTGQPAASPGRAPIAATRQYCPPTTRPQTVASRTTGTLFMIW